MNKTLEFMAAMTSGWAAAWRGYAHKRAFLAAFAAVFAAALVFFWMRLDYAFAHQFGNNCIFGGDHGTYAGRLVAGKAIPPGIIKHPLAFVLFRMVLWIAPVLHIAYRPFAITVLALIAAGVVSGLMALLVRQGASILLAVAAAAFFASCFSVVTVFSQAETYSISCATILLTAWASVEASRGAGKFPRAAGAMVGVAGGLAGLAMPPAAAAVLLYACREPSRQLSWTKIRSRLLLPIALALLPVLCITATRPGSEVRYIEHWASLANFTHWQVVGDYFAAFFLFTFASPFALARHHYAVQDLAAMLEPLRLASLAASVALVAIGIARAWRCERGPTLAAIATGAVWFGFFLYFNPAEAMLYAPMWTLVFVLAAGRGWRGSFGFIAMVVVAASLNFTVNADAFRFDVAKGYSCPEITLQ